MIKSTDLRLGNLVIVENDLRDENGYIHKVTEVRLIDCQVQLYKMDSIYGQKYKFIKPIPLTEELLKKGGFINHNSIFKKDRIGIDNSLDPYHWSVRILQSEETSFFAVEIKYVHELQNVYKLLCGHDLVFSEA